MTTRYAVQQVIPREVMEAAIYPANLIGYTIMDMLEELIPEQEKAGTFDVSTLDVGGQWDALTNAFLISVKCDTE